MLTLLEASKRAGISKTTLWNHIKRGKVSAHRGDNQEYLIDPAELFRAYNLVNDVNVNVNRLNIQNEQKLTGNEHQLTAEIELYKRLYDQIKDERDYLRERLENEATERKNLMLLLTYEREKEQVKPEHEQPIKSSLYEKLFGKKTGR